MKKSARSLASLVIFLLVSCAPQTDARDPFEGFNRGVYTFNSALDNMILEPVARLYRFATPQIARTGVHNFLVNLTSPVVFLNNVLQGDGTQAFTTFWRFVLNSTLGFGGVYDFATANTDLRHRAEDFGQTMGVWGTASGPYLVLPIIGPSSGRDAFGLVVDVASDPLTWLLSDGWSYGYYGARLLDSRERNLDLIDNIERNSLDPYATIRSAYLQKRQAQVENRNSNTALDQKQ